MLPLPLSSAPAVPRCPAARRRAGARGRRGLALALALLVAPIGTIALRGPARAQGSPDPPPSSSGAPALAPREVARLPPPLLPPLTSATSGDPLIEMESLLDAIDRKEAERDRGRREVLRATLWGGAALALTGLATWAARDDPGLGPMPAPVAWTLLGTAGLALVAHDLWRGWRRAGRAEVELLELDQRLRRVTSEPSAAPVGTGASPTTP